MPRPPDIGWQHGEMVGDRNRVKCNYCHQIFNGGITKFKRHFLGNKRQIKGCTSAPEEVGETMRRYCTAVLQNTGADGAFIRDPNACNQGTHKITTKQTTFSNFFSPIRRSMRLRARKRKHIDAQEQMKQRNSEIHPIKSFYVSSLPLYLRAKKLRGIKERYTCSKELKKLDTNVFESYLEYLWSSVSDEKRESYMYLDCLWFLLYKKGPSRMKILTWVKKKQIFSRKYVFVPIICWRHWSLLILCHFGESFQSRTKKPCMLLLDSLCKTDPMRLEPDIRRFVLDIYESEGCEEKIEFVSKIPLLVPKVPQQRNGEECGIFVLYFVYRFLQSAPEVFSLEGYPYCLTEDWFSWEDTKNFYKEVLHFASVKDSMRCNDEGVH